MIVSWKGTGRCLCFLVTVCTVCPQRGKWLLKSSKAHTQQPDREPPEISMSLRGKRFLGHSRPPQGPALNPAAEPSCTHTHTHTHTLTHTHTRTHTHTHAHAHTHTRAHAHTHTHAHAHAHTHTHTHTLSHNTICVLIYKLWFRIIWSVWFCVCFWRLFCSPRLHLFY